MESASELKKGDKFLYHPVHINLSGERVILETLVFEGKVYQRNGQYINMGYAIQDWHDINQIEVVAIFPKRRIIKRIINFLTKKGE